jgi:hypothetical protein
MPGSSSQALTLSADFGKGVLLGATIAVPMIVIVTTTHAAAKAAIVMRAFRLTTQNRAPQPLQR